MATRITRQQPKRQIRRPGDLALKNGAQQAAMTAAFVGLDTAMADARGSQRDTLYNVVAALGGDRDKSSFTRFIMNAMTREQALTAYRADWVARKCVRIPADDSTSKWRQWMADEDQVEAIEEQEQTLRVQEKTRQLMTKARLFGGALMVMGVRDDDPARELDPESVREGDLRHLTVLSRYQVSTGQLVRDVLSPYYGQPEWYEITTKNAARTRLHPSRIVRMVGEEIPDEDMNSDGWGDSVLQSVDDAVKNVGLCSQGIAGLVWEAKTDVIRIPGFMENMGTDEYESKITERFTLANTAKSFVNALLLDKEEEWDRIETHFAGLPDVLKLYLLIASGAVDVPATRFLGQSAQGLNSTGESDLQNYDDSITSKQKNDVTPALMPLDEVMIRSALGDRPEEIYYDWRPLRQMTALQKADLNKKNAEAFKIDVDTGVINEEALAKGRVNQIIETGAYPGFELALEEATAAAEADLDEDDPDVVEQSRASRGLQPRKPTPALPAPGEEGAVPAEVEEEEATDEFNEEDHPRDPSGKFGSGSSGGPGLVGRASGPIAEQKDFTKAEYRAIGAKLSGPQVDAIYAYGAQSDQVNRALRTGKGMDKWSSFAKNLDGAIRASKLSESRTFYRGVPGSVVDKLGLRVGSTITDKGFMSTSLSPRVAGGFASRSRGGRLMVISASRGKSALPFGSAEKEVLLPRGTKLKITGMDKKNIYAQVQ